MARFVSISMALICMLALFAMFAFFGCGRPYGNAMTGNPPSPVDCNAGPTDKEIVDAIYAAIDYKGYGSQEWQFNITANSAGKKVTMIGWSKDRGQIIPIVQAAVKNCTVEYQSFVFDKANMNANYQMRMGCPNGYGPCGDICIPVGEPCKITGLDSANSIYVCAPANNSPNTNTVNINTNTNTANINSSTNHGAKPPGTP